MLMTASIACLETMVYIIAFATEAALNFELVSILRGV